MKTRIAPHLDVEFDSAEQETAGWIVTACKETIPLIAESWGLGPPADCHFYLMTSPVAFFFRSAPWGWRILLGLSFPLWYPRARRTWPYSAAWTQSYGRRVAIGIKPPRLWEQSDKSIGLMMYEKEEDVRLKVYQLACHELTHACSAHLRMPAWLNEGIAALTVERYLQKRIIRPDTLALVRDYQPKGPPPTYRELSRMNNQAIASHTVRGYWLVRYLEETHPGWLKSKLALSSFDKLFTAELSYEIGLAEDRFWNGVDGLIVAHFETQA
jgi:hypothetical protein